MNTCSVQDCGRRTVARGLCSGHHKQQSRGHPLTPLRSRELVNDDQIVLRLPSALRARIERAARKADMDASEWIRSVVSKLV